MKNIFLLTLCMTLSFTLLAQDKYVMGMQKAFQLWEEAKTTEATAMFERIAQADAEKWHPAYYAANVLISSSFTVEDKTARNDMLEKAKRFIAMAHERSSDNSEIHTLEGLLYTSYVAMEPEVYAMQYSNKIMEMHGKAVAINDKNPRAQANLIEYEMGGARFFKQDMSPFCERLKEVIPLFEAEEKSKSFDPRYGLERVQGLIEECGK